MLAQGMKSWELGSVFQRAAETFNAEASDKNDNDPVRAWVASLRGVERLYLDDTQTSVVKASGGQKQVPVGDGAVLLYYF